MASRTIIPKPSSNSPVSSIQGGVAYGDGNPSTVTYINFSFSTVPGSQTWTAAYKAEFRVALAEIEKVANIRFVETSRANADIDEIIAPRGFFNNANTLGYHYTPFPGPSEGAYNTAYWKANSGLGGNGDPGGFFFTTLIHELGHALGLGHPHDTGLGTTILNGVTSAFDSFGTGNLNQGVFTVMSYNDGWTSQNGSLRVDATYGGSTGFGALDIAALQAMYGANTTYNTGNNTYVLPSANVAGTGYQAIWDAGGNDTLQHVGGTGANIDLRPATLDYSDKGGGLVSYVSGVKGGFTIAHGVVIENASGGSGNDTIIGNAAQNILWGNNGNDVIVSQSNGTNDNTLYGGLGNDVFYLAVSSGADRVLGGQGSDLAIVTVNGGSFSGGSGSDTVRFVSAVSNYLFFDNGTSYVFLDVVSRVSFTVESDVEGIQFLNGNQKYTQNDIQAAMQLTEDIDLQGTTLKHAAHGLYVLDAGGLNLGVVYQGQALGKFSLTGWQAIQAEADGSDFRVLWQKSDGSYSEWTLDATGKFVSGGAVSNVVDVEAFYNVDLNNDSMIGHAVTAVESNGATTLDASTRGVYVINNTIDLTLNGANAGPNSYPGWQAIQAEADGSGFRVLWKKSDGSYSEWIVDATGKFVSGGAVSNVVDVEAFYNVDLNNDSMIGHAVTAVESNGATTLDASTRGVYVINNTIDLTLNGANAGPNSYPGWQAIQAEADGSGFRVLWKKSDGSYSEWIVDGTGEFVSGGAVSNVVDVEAFYNVDLNNDSTIGHTTTAIESNGATTLDASTRGVYVINNTIDLTLNGANAGPNSYPGWQAIQAEADGSGFRVLWKKSDGSYSEWIVDGTGEFVSGGAVSNVVDVEAFYNVDLNNDSTIGHTTTAIESNGATTLDASTRGVYVINNAIDLTLNGANAGPNSYPGWQAIHAEADGSGFRVLWKKSDGSYSEWVVDGNGAFISGRVVPDVIDVEAFYGYDIDGSGTVGYELPKLAPPSSPEPKLASDDEALDLSDWDETTDLLKFLPDMNVNEVENNLTPVEMLNARASGIPGVSDQSEITWFNLPRAEDKEDLDPLIATLLEQDGFLL